MRSGITVVSLSGFVAALSFIVYSSTCHAATVTVSQVSGVPSQRGLSVPVSLSSGASEEVAAGQFDIVFNSSVLSLTEVTAGAATTAAGKDVNFSTVEPGRVRVIIAGINQNVIPDGIIANALFTIPRSSPGGEQTVTLSGLLLSDPNGAAVPSTAVSGSITVAAEVPTGANGFPGMLLVFTALVAVAVCLGGATLFRTRLRHRTR